MAIKRRIASGMEFLHGLLEVGVKAGHAAGKERVHHILGEQAAELGLEERDHVGLQRLPGKMTTEAHHAAGCGTAWPHKLQGKQTQP